jgi:hypothetical protein
MPGHEGARLRNATNFETRTAIIPPLITPMSVVTQPTATSRLRGTPVGACPESAGDVTAG